MAKKCKKCKECKKCKKKKHKPKDIALIVGMINGIITTICLIYSTFFG